MAFDAAATRLQRALLLLDQAGTPAAGLVVLTTADPNAPLVAAQAGMIGVGTDQSVWMRQAAAWVPIAGTGGGVPNPIPDDYPVFIGDAEDLRVELISAVNTLVFGGSPLAPVARVPADPPSATVFFSSPVSVVTGDATGTTSTGDVTVQTGGAVDADAASMSGDTGEILVRSGRATSVNGGAGGDSGDVTIATGPAGANAGQVTVQGGPGVQGGTIAIIGGDSTGGQGAPVRIVAGSGSTLPGTIQHAGSVVEHGGADLGVGAQGPGTPQLVRVARSGGDPVTTNPMPFMGFIAQAWVVKGAGTGGVGDNIVVEASPGNTITFDLNGVAPGTVVPFASATIAGAPSLSFDAAVAILVGDTGLDGTNNAIVFVELIALASA